MFNTETHADDKIQKQNSPKVMFQYFIYRCLLGNIIRHNVQYEKHGDEKIQKQNSPNFMLQDFINR